MLGSSSKGKIVSDVNGKIGWDSKTRSLSDEQLPADMPPALPGWMTSVEDGEYAYYHHPDDAGKPPRETAHATVEVIFWKEYPEEFADYGERADKTKYCVEVRFRPPGK